MKKIYTALAICICCITLLHGQNLNMELLKGMKPRAIGPAGMSGRVTSIDVVTNDPDIMYVGTASGGLWKSTSGGIKWEPIFDNEKTGSIGAVAVQQSNPSVIWVGTGEGNPRNSLNGGYGIYKSLDGGKSWKCMGLEETRHIHRVIIDPTEPNTVYVGAIGSPWGEHPQRGVYKTTDGGETWKKILFVDNKTGLADLVMDPSNPNKLIAAMWQHRRKPWTFTSGGPGSGLFMTHDGGKNWKKLTSEDGLPEGELGRIGLAFAPSKPNIVYALIESKKNALYRSEDGGFKWTKINDKDDIGNRPFYYSDIYVDPVNENRVYSIFTYVNVSQDGGKSFTQLMPAYGVDNGVHPDHHAWWIHPNDPDFMVDGNDGGLNITKDGGKTWRFVENLPVAQFYHISVDNEFPYNVYGGMQDNGSWGGPAYVLKAQGIRNAYWQELAFGDGFDVVPDPDDTRYGYAMSQQGFVSRYDRETGYNHMIRPTHPDPEMRLRFNWNAAIAQDPFDNNTIYFGSQFVHKSTDKGDSWTVISPDLTTNDPEKQKQDESGGLTMDATGAENHTTILVIAPSPVQKDLLWVGTDDGQVQLSKDGGKSWQNITANVPQMPQGSWITQIKPSGKNAGEALMVVNDYRRYNYKPYAYRTKDFGQTWQRIVDENKVFGYALSIVEDPVEPNLLFLGTDDGLYVSINGGNSWTKWNNGFPSVSTKDLAIQPREHDLVIGTFGRAAYILDDIRPLRELARNSGKINQTVALYEPPTAYITVSQQPSGTRFGGDAMFNGENRKSGAMISYSFNKPDEQKAVVPEETAKNKKGKKTKNQVETKEESKDEAKTSYDSLIFNIFKGDELIRTLKIVTPKDEGLNRTYWDLTEKGPIAPTREAPKKNAPEPAGVTVLPGSYKIVINYGDQKDSTNIEVKYDPRLTLSTDDLQAKYEALKRLESFVIRSEKAVAQLRQSKEIADDLAKDLKKENGEQYKSQIEQCKSMADSINQQIDLFIGKEDKRQGITLDYTQYVDDRINWATFYTQNHQGAPSKVELEMIEKAEVALKDAIENTNNFYETVWRPFQEEMEKVELSRFAPIQKLE